ncbi:MAG: TlpA family protein disulfide reductase [Flavobacteriales bacterium]|nr:TlpA family protein disulfide reductase [Flavobacteriales bacterium]
MVLTLILGCAASGPHGTTITLDIQGAGGATVYFNRFENNRPVHVDSVRLDDAGRGSLQVPPVPMDFYQLQMKDGPALVIAMDSTCALAVEAGTGHLDEPTALSGCPATESLYAFYRKARRFEIDLDSMKHIIQGAQDTSTINALNRTNRAYYEFCEQFIANNPGSPALLSAIGKLNIQQEFDSYKSVRDQLRGPMASSAFYVNFRDQVDRVEKQLQARQQQEQEMERMSNLIPIGSMAPDIAEQTPQGGTFALSALRGQYVLIDFWASWCRPCRMEMPNVKRVYERFHAKGFEILGVSLDRTHDAWVKAIEQDGLPWKHVSDLGFWNNAAAQEYGVSSIPFTVLVDPDGKVIAKGLRGPALEQKLAEVLGS